MPSAHPVLARERIRMHSTLVLDKSIANCIKQCNQKRTTTPKKNVERDSRSKWGLVQTDNGMFIEKGTGRVKTNGKELSVVTNISASKTKNQSLKVRKIGIFRAVASSIIGGGLIFIYSGSAQLISFQINCFMVCEHEYMNISPPPPIIELARPCILHYVALL